MKAKNWRTFVCLLDESYLFSLLSVFAMLYKIYKQTPIEHQSTFTMQKKGKKNDGRRMKCPKNSCFVVLRIFRFFCGRLTDKRVFWYELL